MLGVSESPECYSQNLARKYLRDGGESESYCFDKDVNYLRAEMQPSICIVAHFVKHEFCAFHLEMNVRDWSLTLLLISMCTVECLKMFCSKKAFHLL